MPASRAMASALASAYPTRANTAAAAANRRARWRSCRTSSGGAWRPRGAAAGGRSAIDPMVSVREVRSRLLRPITRAALRPPPALAAAGCGAAQTNSSSKFKGEQGQVAKVVDDLSSAGQHKDAAKICKNILSTSLVAQLKAAGGDCQQEMKKAIDDADTYDLQVQGVSIDGNQAQAHVRQGTKGPFATFQFVRENGGWRGASRGGARDAAGEHEVGRRAAGRRAPVIAAALAALALAAPVQ